ncbi:hypothetical protein PCANC_11443 [Puccinia coronata f. sp. avenae]|uniref:proline--tRNA ligase n=1 Tax=Puccinia coronata f. sp. avenae TaxID=200324 RepID=A0A2N5VCN3_9BASI|nr:hypothetical protein PCANC_11443 [Puccinia coronata f. sp. avenae]
MTRTPTTTWKAVNRRYFASTSGTLHPATYQSKRYSPTIKNQHAADGDAEHESQSTLLVRAGFVRQSSSGIWSFLPNGLRVIKKIQSIVSKEMERIHATEISMPLLQTQKLWERSGRWNQAGPELFRITDRKGSSLLLSPTHEEEVTHLLKSDIDSSKQLPIKLFHIGRKFRDEARPRAGLLRSREFIMKDLYTFDTDPTAAMESYKQVQEAYRRIFETIGIPFTVAEADSGAIGGATSHEYHYQSSSGEDTLIHCPRCRYTANQELARSTLSPKISDPSQLQVQFYSAPESRRFLAVVLPRAHQIHPLKLSKVSPDIQPLPSDGGPPKFEQEWDRLEVLIDESCIGIELEEILDCVTFQFRHDFPPPSAGLPNPSSPGNLGLELRLELSPLSIWPSLPVYTVHDLRTVSVGSSACGHTSTTGSFQELCPDCASPLESCAAIEVGHTFYLGTKYSDALGLRVAGADAATGKRVDRAVEMGCYGIGISRLVSAIGVCSQVSGRQGGGLRWPISVAPFKICIIVPGGPDGIQTLPVATKLAELLEKENTGLGDDVVVDDRDQRIGWKLADAELVGNPILIILGNRWRSSHCVEVRNLISASHSEIFVPPGPSSSSKETVLLDLQPVVLHVIAEIHKLTPRVS